MDQKSKKKMYFAILAATLLVFVVVAAGVMILGHNTMDKTQTPGISPGTISDSRDLFPDKAYPEYARGYSVEYHGTYKVVQIHDPWGRAVENHTYLLVQRGENVPGGYPGARIFYVPVESVITLTVLHTAYISELNETSTLVGHNAINSVIGEAFRNRAAAGKITEVGSGTLSMNNIFQTEKMIELEPDIVFCNANGNPEYDRQNKLEEAGLKPAITAESSESHPLGRAEWIKYYSLFFNKEKKANEIFGRIESNYTAIAKKARNISNRPTLFSGMEYQGTWYAPGGGSYTAQLFRDAGGDYILANDSSSG
ncbi:MAG: ABC transporter substrate-binding protein, partial [Methanoregula sp.]|nr:ABC transporter substrate-binding protein [Methanoregula sp.]